MELNKYDSTQNEMMSEMCILVDEQDTVIGSDSKKNCHYLEGKLHRAFSVLLFNSRGEFLLQKRAGSKITFPSFWANACCSHPLYIDEEVNGGIGVKNAAIRKMEQELGVERGTVEPSELELMTRMHYESKFDDEWIEREMDYILILKKDLKLNPNPNEIEEVRYFDINDLDKFVKNADNDGNKIGPWFRLINDNFLYEWWKSLDRVTEAKNLEIHKFGRVK
tara:strand:+ start:318 stop:983 length:666 start_codon:yes stop_codon:yes gene_type:complete